MRRILLALIVLPIGHSADLARAGDGEEEWEPPPLVFDAPPLTAQDQSELISYRLYLSGLIRKQIDQRMVHALVKEAGDALSARSVKFKMRISPSGHLTWRRVARTCGYEPLDTLFLKALDEAGPFASPPKFTIFQPQDIDVTFSIAD